MRRKAACIIRMTICFSGIFIICTRLTAITAGSVKTTADPVYIGSRVGRITDRNWNGWIDDVRIYDTALTEANLLYLAEQEPIVRIPGPRPTDLIVDGVIDIEDLAVFVQSRMQDSHWP